MTVIPGPDAVVVNTDKAIQMSHEHAVGRSASTKLFLPRSFHESHPELKQQLEQAVANARDAHKQSAGSSTRTELLSPENFLKSHPELQQQLEKALAHARNAHKQLAGRKARAARRLRDYLEGVRDQLASVDWGQDLEQTLDVLDQLARAYERGQRIQRVEQSLLSNIAARRGR